MKRYANAILFALIALLAPLAQAVTPEDKAALISEAEALIESQRAVDEAVAAYKSKLYGLKLDDPTVAPAWKSAVGWEAAQPLYRNLRDTMLGHLRSIEPTEPPVVVEPPDPIEPPDPPVDPDPTATSIFIDAEGGPSWGNDTNDGMTAGSPVATHQRAKEIALKVVQANPGTVVSFRFRRGDTFPSFGEIRGYDPAHSDNLNAWQHEWLNGSPDQYLVITGYGEGPRPVFVGGFHTSTKSQSYIELRGVEVHGGVLVSCRSNGRGLRILDCVGIDAGISVQAGTRFTGLEVRGCVIRDVIQRGSAHAQGMFVNRVDNWSLTDTVFYRCGWMQATATTNGAFQDPMTGEWLKLSIYNHGVYVTGDCAPATECDRNVFIYNSGSGIQLRPGGNCRDNYAAWNGQTGINWGSTFGANSDDVPGSGELTGNVVFNDTGVSGAITVGDLGSGRIAGNLLYMGSRGVALQINSIHGDNPSGGTWYGINNLVVEDNRLVGNVELQGDGWGVMGADGVTFKASNQITGDFVEDAFESDPNKQRFLFADPLGKVVREAGQTGAVIDVTPPVLDADAVEPILSGEKSAADLISEVIAK